MFVEDLNADFNAADLDDRESNGDDIFMLLPLIFGAFGKIPSTIRLIYQKLFNQKLEKNLLMKFKLYYDKKTEFRIELLPGQW